MKSFDIFLEIPEDSSSTQIHVHHNESVKLEYPIHYHPTMELLYCYGGSLTVHLDQSSYIMEKDSFALISPMAVHGFSCPQTCSCAFIHIPETVFLQIEHIFSLSALHTGYIFQGQQYRKLFHNIFRYASNDDHKIASYYAMILLTLCIREVQDVHGQVISFENNSYPLLREILAYIQNHYKENITLDYLCSHFSIGKSTLSRLINKDLQFSLPELINKYRMLEAKHLLMQTQQSITEIAEHLGYSSVCNFNRNFQKHYGVSPREYRKQKKSPVQ